jgi:hypothetical protein
MKNRQLCAFDMSVDDLDDQGRPFLYLLQDAVRRRATAQQRRAQRHCWALKQVYSTGHPGRPGHPYGSLAAISRNCQSRPIFSVGRPGRPGAGWRGSARACPRSSPRGQALRSVVLSMGRSYARSDSAAMSPDEGWDRQRDASSPIQSLPGGRPKARSQQACSKGLHQVRHQHWCARYRVS